MKALMIALVFSLSFGGLALGATADDEEGERFGEIHITLKNATYAKVDVNGGEWSGVEFERDGKLLLVKGLPLVGEGFEVTVRPFDETFGEESFKLEDKDFKKRRKGRFYYFIAAKTLKFDKVKDAPAEPTPEPDPEPKPKPDEDDDFDL